MKTCGFLSALQDWVKEGNLTAMPEGLRSHVGRCDSCGSFVLSVNTAREWGQLLPTSTLAQTRHDAMKFLLMAEARQSGKLAGTGLGRTRVTIRVLALAAVLSSAAAATTVTRQYLVAHEPSTQQSPEATAVNEARPLSGIQWQSPKAHVAPPASASHAGLAFTTKASQTSESTPTRNKPISTSAEPRAVGSADSGDGEFAQAWTALRAKRPREAASRFDALLNSSSLDAARRADILYWSAQSHRQAGNTGVAMSRSSQLLRQFPSAPFASDAALMLGEFALASDQFDLARQYLKRASASQHTVVRERANRALEKLTKPSTK